MDQALTLNSVYQLGLLLALIAGLWWRVETRISGAAVDAMEKANAAMLKAEAAQVALGTYQLVVAEKYATASAMKEVEERLVSAINNLTTAMNEMPSRVAEVFNAGQSNRSRARSQA